MKMIFVSLSNGILKQFYNIRKTRRKMYLV